MMFSLKYLVPFIALVNVAWSFEINPWSNQGEVALEYRRFEDDNDPATKDIGLSVFTRVQTEYEKGPYKHLFRGYARAGGKDEERSFVALEDFYFSRLFGEAQSFKLLAGYKLFNWTATEAFHPADMINSRNFDSNLEKFEKKGELTLEARLDTSLAGSFQLFLFPRFEEPEFPGAANRLGIGADLNRPLVVDDSEAKDEKWFLQYGFRWSKVFDDFDISLHYLDHINRKLPIVGTANYTYNQFLGKYVPLDTPLTPYHFRVRQIGGTFQYVFHSLLIKLEGAYRDFVDDDFMIYTTDGFRSPEDHTEVAFGFEYGTAINQGQEVFFFFEGQGLFGPDKKRRSELNSFQRDLLVGSRYAFNDVMGSEIFASAIFDVERDDEILYNAYFTRRISDLWRGKIGYRIYDAPPKTDTPVGLEILNDDNYGYIELTRYF